MRDSLRFFLLGLFFLAALSAAARQEPAMSIPASTNVRAADYPRILPDNRVTFRIKAPSAHKVEFDLGRRYPAEKDADGFWSATTEPQVPGFHYYWLVIDGVMVNDPASETFYGVGKESSGIEIPEKGIDYYLPKDVPHGEVRERWYFARTTQVWRRVFVYTPPDYDANRDARYPVLYLQHGGGEDERGWPNQGRVGFILDNLIATGKAKPMLVVMEQGYARKPGEPEVPLGPPAAAPTTAPVPPDFSRMFAAFEEVMIRDLIPMIDATYRTIPDRDHRAMAGLSMGGGQALSFGRKHLDTFAWGGSFSPAPNTYPPEKLVPNPAKATSELKLLWLSCGDQDALIPLRQRIHSYLKEKNVPHIWHVSHGAHTTPTWKEDLYLFAQQVFQSNPPTRLHESHD